MEDVKLLASLYWLAVRSTHEINSKRGLTKRTIKEEEKLIQDLADRFGFEPEDLQKLLDK